MSADPIFELLGLECRSEWEWEHQYSDGLETSWETYPESYAPALYQEKSYQKSSFPAPSGFPEITSQISDIHMAPYPPSSAYERLAHDKMAYAKAGYPPVYDKSGCPSYPDRTGYPSYLYPPQGYEYLDYEYEEMDGYPAVGAIACPPHPPVGYSALGGAYPPPPYPPAPAIQSAISEASGTQVPVDIGSMAQTIRSDSVLSQLCFRATENFIPPLHSQRMQERVQEKWMHDKMMHETIVAERIMQEKMFLSKPENYFAAAHAAAAAQELAEAAAREYAASAGYAAAVHDPGNWNADGIADAAPVLTAHENWIESQYYEGHRQGEVRIDESGNNNHAQLATQRSSQYCKNQNIVVSRVSSSATITSPMEPHGKDSIDTNATARTSARKSNSLCRKSSNSSCSTCSTTGKLRDSTCSTTGKYSDFMDTPMLQTSPRLTVQSDKKRNSEQTADARQTITEDVSRVSVTVPFQITGIDSTDDLTFFSYTEDPNKKKKYDLSSLIDRPSEPVPIKRTGSDESLVRDHAVAAHMTSGRNSYSECPAYPEARPQYGAEGNEHSSLDAWNTQLQEDSASSAKQGYNGARRTWTGNPALAALDIGQSLYYAPPPAEMCPQPPVADATHGHGRRSLDHARRSQNLSQTGSQKTGSERRSQVPPPPPAPLLPQHLLAQRRSSRTTRAMAAAYNRENLTAHSFRAMKRMEQNKQTEKQNESEKISECKSKSFLVEETHNDSKAVVRDRKSADNSQDNVQIEEHLDAKTQIYSREFLLKCRDKNSGLSSIRTESRPE